MKKDDNVFLRHILDAITRIKGYVAGLKREDFMVNYLVQDGVIRQIEIIGEAAKNYPEKRRKSIQASLGRIWLE